MSYIAQFTNLLISLYICYTPCPKYSLGNLVSVHLVSKETASDSTIPAAIMNDYNADS